MAESVTQAEYRALAEVRYRIRRFQNFSEASARSVGLEPQQHQLLLAIKGMPASAEATIGGVAERLQIQHNSAVELVNRSSERGLVKKRTGSRDRRQVLLEITPYGRRVLEKLAVAHRAELRRAAPTLLTVLSELVASAPLDSKLEEPVT